jgi:hypothetical protein
MDDNRPRPEYPIPKKIRLGYSDIHFRGVFATDDIETGELIERCPAVVMGWRTNYQKDPVVWEYMYTSSCPCEECKRHGSHFVMVMGYGQIYNHQDDNNASIKVDMISNMAEIVANRKIRKGEEIFVSYGSKYFEKRNKINSVNSGDSKCTNQTEYRNVIKPL